jgi:hypothetical protein
VVIAITAKGGIALAADHTTESIRKVWESRAERIRTASFALEKEDTVPKGLYDRVTASRRVQHETSEPNPPRDMVNMFRVSVSVDGHKLRYEQSGVDWSETKREMRKSSRVSTYDGNKYTVLNEYGLIVDYPNASIKTGAIPIERQEMALLPIWLFLRCTYVYLHGYELATYEIAASNVVINQRRCIQLLQTSKRTGTQTSLYLDVERDYILVRQTTVQDGKTIFSLDTEYMHTQTDGWVPSTWKYAAMTTTGQLILSVRCRLLEYKTNTDLPSSLFDQELPSGTRVTEFSSGVEKQFVILPTGQRGKAFGREHGVLTYEQLIAAGPESTLFDRLMVPALIAVGIMSLFWFLVRRWRLISSRGLS